MALSGPGPEVPADAFPLHVWVTDADMTERYLYHRLDGPGDQLEIPVLHRLVNVVCLYEGHAVLTVNGDGVPMGGIQYDVHDVPEFIKRIEELPPVLVPGVM